MRGSTRRVALLVDGDNLSPGLAPALLAAAEALGEVAIRRVYGRADALAGWDSAPALRPVRAGGLKNGTDLLLCIEAVDLASQGRMEAVALASDDRDFSHLAAWLRERGLPVLGLGTAKASEDWRASCSTFQVLGAVAPPPGAPATGVTATQRNEALEANAGRVVREAGLGGLAIADFGHRMTACSFTRASIAEAGWRAWLEARPDRFALDPKGPGAHVRLRA